MDAQYIQPTKKLLFVLGVMVSIPSFASELSKEKDLYHAAASGDLERVMNLVDLGVNVNEKENGTTALHNAVYSGSKPVVRYLVEHGADVNAETEKGWTSLHIAAYNSSAPIVEYLIKHKANVNAKTNVGETPLSIAEANDNQLSAANQKVIKYFVDHGAKR